MARPLVALQVSALAEALGICGCCVQTHKSKASPSCSVYFIGATADAFTLFERLEMQLEAHPGATFKWQSYTYECALVWALGK